MEKVRTNGSAVLVARDMNLSILKSWWLVRNDIIKEEEIDNEAAFSPGVVRIASKEYEFIGLPDRLQLRFPPIEDDPQLNIVRILGGIVSKLPHTPYSAIGLNFDFLFAVTNCSAFDEWNNQFFRPRWTKNLSKSMLKFGSYCSYDWNSFRAKISVKPVQAIGGAPQNVSEFFENHAGNCMQASFNFHYDIKDEDHAPEIVNLLAMWTDALQEASSVLSVLESIDG